MAVRYAGREVPLDLHSGRPLTENDYTRCCISTIRPPDDEKDVARNMWRTVINVLYNKTIVCQVGHLQEKILDLERGSTRSQSVGNSLWEKVWTYRKADCVMMILMPDFITGPEF